MKFAKNKARSFWKWFASVAPRLESEPLDSGILSELDKRLLSLHSRLSWEIGPGKNAPWQFAVSPNRDTRIKDVAHAIVAEAPFLSNWEFYDCKQPKEWNFAFVYDGFELDVSKWKYIILEYDDGFREVVFEGKAQAVPENKHKDLAEFVLEGTCGESVFMGMIQNCDLVSKVEPELSTELAPIQSLKSAIERLGTDFSLLSGGKTQ
jgi:hypothetical protein